MEKSKYSGRPKGSITEAVAIAEALTCKTRSEFSGKFSGSWRFLWKLDKKHGTTKLDDACSHMTGYQIWTTEKVVALALTCKTRGEFKKKHTAAYNHMSSNNLHHFCHAHMGPPKQKGRKKDQKKLDKLELQSNCEHVLIWRGRNQMGKLFKCSKCEKIVVVEKTNAERIADLIKAKIKNA